LAPRLFTTAIWLILLGPAAARAAEGWTPEVRALLTRVLHTQRPPAGGEAPVVVFDFDNTLIHGDLGHGALAYLGDEGLVPAGTDPAWRASPDTATLYAHYHQMGQTRSKESALAFLASLLAGRTLDEARRVSEATLTRGLEAPRCTRSYSQGLTRAWGIRLRTPMTTLIKELGAAGLEVWIVTASPQALVRGVSARLGVPPERVLGVRTEVVDGRLTRALVPPVTYRQGKVEVIKRHIGRRPMLVLGDAWTDIEMLRYAEHGVLMDRGVPELRRAAREAGVLIQPLFEGEERLAPCPASLFER
jgi:phosphoserine phosphatase